MQKKVYIIISLLLIVIGIFLLCNKSSNETTFLDEVKLKDVEEENSMFAIMIQDGENYIPYQQETWPTDGYTFNEEKSGCLDSEGKKIKGIALTFDELTKKVKVETDVTSYCYIYFDKKSSKAGDVIKDKVNTGGLKQLTDDSDLAYRYVGTNSIATNNYICFGTTNKEDCTKSNSNYLYRIIGIDKKNRLKLIKSIRLPSTYKWNNSYGNTPWNESGMHKYLYLDAAGFYNNSSIAYVPADWKIKIDTNTWNIGDVGGDRGLGTQSSEYENASAVLTAEQASTLPGSENNKIGLMYLSDYYYAYNEGEGTTNCYSASCTSWLTDTSNDTWTMTRYGLLDSRYTAWVIDHFGKVGYGADFTREYAVRPVFYLTADSKIDSGTGTNGDPYILDNPNKKGIEFATEKFGSVPSGFYTVPTGDLYRFIGNNPDNYICFGTTDATLCKESNGNNNYMYRIIGADTNGRLKVIKSTKLASNHNWHSSNQSNTLWNESTMFTYLNTDSNGFYANNNNTYVSEKWKSKIDTNIWNIGDVNTTTNSGVTTNATTVLTAEQASTLPGSESNKIGLMNLSDYYYAYNNGQGTIDCNKVSSCPSWLTDTNNDTWTMTRFGSYSSNYYGAWIVRAATDITYSDLNRTYAVRPVFYLKPDVKITSGTGTASDPFLIN